MNKQSVLVLAAVLSGFLVGGTPAEASYDNSESSGGSYSKSSEHGMSYEDKAKVIRQAADELRSSNPELAAKLDKIAKKLDG